jgi:heterodisulfide reductase subunit A-like polyferredoxin
MRLSCSSLFVVSALVHSIGALSIDSTHDILTHRSDDVIVRDVVIIGGGSAGTHAAISLKDKGKSIIVIEKKARLGGHTETYTAASFTTTSSASMYL